MAIVHPRALPLNNFGNVSFDLQRFESVTHLRGGQTQVDERGDPRFLATYRTRPLLPANNGDRLIIGEWEAFYNSLRGNDKTFLGFDPVHEYPGLYPAGAGLGGWSGLASTTSISAFSLSVSLSGASDITVSPGDHVSLFEGGKYSLHMILETRTAAGSSLTSLTVEPYINVDLFHAGVASANFIRPVCIMQRVAGSWSASKDRSEALPISFQGIQILH